MQKSLPSFFLFLFLLANSVVTAQVDLQITEIFSGQAGSPDLTADWFEIKNMGDVAWVAGVDPDLYYDDESASASEADLINGITDIQPGEYVIVLVTDVVADITIFQGVWSPVYNLTDVEIGYTDGAGLGGGGDAVNIWIGDPTLSSPVNTESYPDTAPADGQTYDLELGAFSTVGNANQAVATIEIGGSGNVPNIGSPGNLGPAIVNPNAPTILADLMNSSQFLQLTEEGPAAIGADLGDPTDPSITTNIAFDLSDADTPLADLTVTATSDNQAVIPDANLVISGTDGDRSLSLTPVGVGYAVITLTVTDTDGNSDDYTIQYAVSDVTIDPTTTRFHYGTSDGSTAQNIDETYMWVADDENQTIRLFDRTQSGMPLYSMNFNADLGSNNEVDIEGSLRNGSQIFWMGSHTNFERSMIFSTEEMGTGASATLTFSGFYDDLRQDLIDWDANNEHGLGADFYGFSTNSFEIEALAADPNNPDGALLGFRGPLVNGKGLVVPVTNFQTMVSMTPVANSAVFGAPIELDLEGHTIRSMDCNSNGCLIVAGPFGPVNDFQLFTWTGNAVDAPELRAADLAAQTNLSAFEGIVELPSTPFLGSNGDTQEIQLLVDTGTFDYYNDGSEAKDLPNDEWKKFRTELVILGEVTIPPVANPGDIVINEIMQNPAVVADENGEWFELFNTTLGDIDINGWILSDNDIDSHTIDNGGPLTVPAGGYLIIGNNADLATNGGVAVDYAYGTALSLSNGADELILTATDLIEIDRVEWDGGTNFPDPAGASMSLQSTFVDNNDGANWCEAMTPYGDGDLGTPGVENDCAPPPSFDLQITEIWMGQDGDDLTADWFEITNFGDVAWTSGVDGDLFYDDDSQDPAVADLINGLTDIQPGASAIVMVDAEAAVAIFQNVWSPDYDLTGVQIGWTDGSGLGQGGDGVTLFLGFPAVDNIIDYETYPAAGSGISYDVVLGAFSQEGAGMVQTGTNIAVATTATAGSSGLEPAIGSPGNQGPLVAPAFDLQITEIFAGQEGDDLTADWFEIRNIGNAPWVAGVDEVLFYDDESADPVAADTIFGLTEIQPGASAVVLITDNTADITVFEDVWSPVIDLTGVGIGYTDGAGLGGGGDAVVLWAGDPNTTAPIDTEAYPDTAPFDGQSYDSDLGAFSVVGNANGAVETIALGGDLMDVPNIGSPGDGLAIAPNTGLVITEIFAGQEGTDLTADWIEITNTGNTAWVSGVDGDLYYDDESADPGAADLIEGITDIQPGASAIVLIGTMADVAPFVDVWSPVIDLTGVQIGYADGAGLGGGGDAATLWIGDPSLSTPVSMEAYPDTAPFDGQSYDSDLGEFSVVGNANGAVATIALGGDFMDTPNIGSPGNGLAIPMFEGLVITEIFAGQEGTDLTEDWFEITNIGTEAWVAGSNADLYYDDESADPVDATIIQGLVDLLPGETAIVLITGDPADITTFTDIWSPVIDLTGVEIGYTDGAGLGGGGDAVTLWMGDPNTVLPLDMASYPDTAPFDGQSYDSDLGAFSIVGNANGAVATIALGGDLMDVPNIGSPGNGLAIPQFAGLQITEIFAGQEGEDLTEDWIEIRNNGDVAWVAGVDPDLYYDDESADPAEAVVVQGLVDLQPGETAIVLITGNTDDITTFEDVWSPVIDLTGIEIGYADGAGLGGGGDAVTLWIGEPSIFAPLTMETYPDTAPFDGQSYDSDLGAFSVVDNANGAVQTIALGGDNMDVPNIGSPGNQGPIISVTELSVGTMGVFPNPTNGWLTVETQDAGQLETVELISATGQRMMIQQVGFAESFTLDLSGYPAGVYYLQVRSTAGLLVERVVKQ